MPITRDLACKPGMCADWESNQQPFGSQAGAQSTEPHQPEQCPVMFIYLMNVYFFYVATYQLHALLKEMWSIQATHLSTE